MIGQLLNENTVQNWIYLHIDKKVLKDRYDWIEASFPNVDFNFPWAVRNDIQRLFYLCISFNSQMEALEWIKANLDIELNQTHLKLISSFSYPKDRTTSDDLNSLIEMSDDYSLLNFIHATLERALLWYNPEPCWPSDFFQILTTGKSIINNSNKVTFVSTESLKTKGVFLVSTDEHTHVFYKFQNICLQLEENKMYSDIKTIAKQSHEALLKSVTLFFEHRILSLDDIKFERKLDSIVEMETFWCEKALENYL